ncbi:MAG: hypothetical protein UY86_C0003G0064 [Candidatus Adlerbacteria bacterium GW2011_GWB1_54_7]|uniref:Uncharacterized protein n=2 Tax=Candidatus Adleribacteriota TaxID=1752736 RepID=A0A0G2AA08_9BACT|nr:MAG: hypothetical protein UY86_C0003G0064 [Candidatus Adlerbacteria bacterium GW2011_GWB1_54_7]
MKIGVCWSFSIGSSVSVPGCGRKKEKYGPGKPINAEAAPHATYTARAIKIPAAIFPALLIAVSVHLSKMRDTSLSTMLAPPPDSECILKTADSFMNLSPESLRTLSGLCASAAVLVGITVLISGDRPFTMVPPVMPPAMQNSANAFAPAQLVASQTQTAGWFSDFFGGNNLTVYVWPSATSPVVQGQNTTLTWQALNADYCTYYGAPPGGTYYTPNYTPISVSVGPIDQDVTLLVYCVNTGPWNTGYGSGSASVHIVCPDGYTSSYETIPTDEWGGGEWGPSQILTCTPPAEPSLQLWPDNSNLPYNGSTGVHWRTQNAGNCHVAGPGTDWGGANGDQSTPALAQYTTYTLSCDNGSQSIGINVAPPPGAPNATIGADSTNIYVGQSVGIHADFAAGSGDSMNGSAINQPANISVTNTNPDSHKDYTFTPASPGAYVFTAWVLTPLYAWNSYASIVVNVSEVPSCGNGLDINVYPSCSCPSGQVQNGSFCEPPPSCQNGLDINSYPSCTCPSGQYQNGNSCSAITAPTAIISSDSPTIHVGESTTIHANFQIGQGDSFTGTNIDQPEGHGVGTGGTATQQTYTFAPTAGGDYTFYARAATANYGWQSYANATVHVISVPPVCTGNYCDIIVDPVEPVLPGTPVTVQWTCNPLSYSSSEGGGFSTGGALQGSTFANPIANTTYVLNCVAPGGSRTLASAVVTVLQPNLNISADPPRVQSGNSSTITWSATNVNANSCAVTSNPAGFSRSGLSDSGIASITSQTVFTLRCMVPAGPVSKTTTVTLVPSYEEI